MRLTVQMSGFDRLSLVTKALTTAARDGLKFGVSEAAFLVETEAKELVPVATGNLRDAIHTEQVTDQPERQVVKVTPASDADNKYGFDPAYARRIEQGFVGTDSLGRVYDQAAQPYMRPAADNKGDEAKQAIVDGVREQVRSVHP